ncbi:2-keto-3-deoxygluconate permease [Lactobacillus sp. UCMA15818]|uniref:2-keto-3-deoxygluconate permease n=1 Tax=Lactobacillus sp. UCMA15818 TaxID=2583394 RepID=UPI0025B0D89C|nr:2-keto-3-deoxygluconate permease [Lactobacillus sp. UCMA15818]MDN2454316.1 2-keto-3-deoxygluconate permease [Lactobacillus sp. UCMA15818]
MKILGRINKVPGGLMVIPLLLGTVFNTFFPSTLAIGGFTTALFKTGTLTLLSLFCFCNGAQISVKQAGLPLIKGSSLTLMRLILGIFFGWLVGAIFGGISLLGIYPLALISAMTNANGGLYGALAGEYGDASDVGAISITTLMDGPFFTMVALGATGTAKLPLMLFIAALVPIILGFILGNLDPELKDFLKAGTVMPIPFFAFSLGAALNFNQIIKAGIPGILLGVMVTLIAGSLGYLLMKHLVRSKHPEVGAAIGTTAGNAAATPAAIAAVLPSFQTTAAAATAQIAASVIVTALLCPVLVSWLAKHRQKNIIPEKKMEL